VSGLSAYANTRGYSGTTTGTSAKQNQNQIQNATLSSSLTAGGGNIVTGCCLTERLPHQIFLRELALSNFSLTMGRGDPGSSRFFDALATGTPQIVLSARFVRDYAPYSCFVPYKEIIQVRLSI
jgi:hypothetical protein